MSDHPSLAGLCNSPVALARDHPQLPHNGCAWLDFRNDGLFDERLEELLRELHGAPRYVKPPLGRNPFAGPELEAAKAAPGGSSSSAPEADALQPFSPAASATPPHLWP